MVSREEYDKHYPSGEPGTHGREPFEDEDTQSNRLDSGRAAAAAAGSLVSGSGSGAGAGGNYGQQGGSGLGSTGLASDSHGGTLSRDTEVRSGEVVGLGGPKDSGVGGLGSAGSGSTVPSGPGAGSGTGAFAAGTGTHRDTSSTGARDTVDKTGNLDQEAHKYESTGPRGPTSSGAPNTDKFDTGSSNYGNAGVAPPPTVEQDDSHRKGTGGVGGILGTTDREFTANPSRTGEGAYNDSHGLFKTNTAGPGGQTALTGREGTAENNPVAQAQSRGQGGEPAGTEGEKKGVMDKIKDAFK